MVGRELGPYRIVAPLGAGGMGEVYRARDSKLGRDVAIKILPSHFTADPERRARFAREARLLATLNHPHIGAIYGLEEADGVAALVLELVEGPTLAERLERGPLPISDALAIARQIAEALDAAHEKGIVHRDLKPANIVLQGAVASGVPSGEWRAKVLDFGLAKTTAVGLPPDLTQRRSGTLDGTAEGRILGTPAYMSPEQARGQAVDKRTDIWAFGCVVFEMLSGRRPFGGDTISDTFVSILEREPDWAVLPAETPASIRTLLERCLRKDPRRRLHDIADALIEIDDRSQPLAASTSVAAVPASVVMRHRRRERLAWIVAAVLGVALCAMAFFYMRPAPPAAESRGVHDYPGRRTRASRGRRRSSRSLRTAATWRSSRPRRASRCCGSDPSPLWRCAHFRARKARETRSGRRTAGPSGSSRKTAQDSPSERGVAGRHLRRALRLSGTRRDVERKQRDRVRDVRRSVAAGWLNGWHSDAGHHVSQG